VEQARDLGCTGGCYDLFRKVDVNGLEGVATLFIQDSDQVDDDIDAREKARQGAGVVYVGPGQADCVEYS
jgi:hypothetical protein